MWHRLGFMDHICAMGSLISTLLALYHRDRTGDTQFVAGSLLAGGVMTGSETYLDAARRDRRHPGARPRADRHLAGVRILPVTDGWIAIAATTDDAARRAVHLAGVGGADALVARTVADALAALARRGRAVRRRCGSTRATRSSRPPTTTPPGLIARYEHVDYGTSSSRARSGSSAIST